MLPYFECIYYLIEKLTLPKITGMNLVDIIFENIYCYTSILEIHFIPRENLGKTTQGKLGDTKGKLTFDVL